MPIAMIISNTGAVIQSSQNITGIINDFNLLDCGESVTPQIPIITCDKCTNIDVSTPVVV